MNTSLRLQRQFQINNSIARFTFISVLLLAGLLFPSCSDAPRTKSKSTLTVSDQLGREIQLDEAPQRVISLMPNVTELLFFVGAGGNVVASAHADSYPPLVETLPRFNSLPLDLENIVSLDPDLIFAVDGLNNPEDSKRLTELGIPTYYLKFESLGDIGKAMTSLGTILGTEEKVKELRSQFDTRINGALPKDSPKNAPSVLVLNSMEVLYSFGKDSYASELVEASGGLLASSALEGNAVILSDEFVLSQDPDIIVLASPTPLSRAEILNENPSWKTLKALKSNNFKTLHPDILLRPGPRIVQAIDSLQLWIDQLD